MADRFALLPGPTPLHRLDRLSHDLDVDLWIKRDDLTGLALGGNKTRKLEYLLADALAAGHDTLVTCGAAQSNHCRQTAAAAARAGLACELALGGSGDEPIDGNLLLDHLLGATVHWCGDARKGETLDAIADAARANGRNPYVVPYGGSNATGARGFVRAARELADQCTTLDRDFDVIAFASSSGGTHAGLMAGTSRAALTARVVGLQIDSDPGPDGDLAATIAGLVTELDAVDGHRTHTKLELVDDGAVAPYGQITSLERDAVQRMARGEGILLDPVYTARAFGVLLRMMEDGRVTPGSRVAFWHTGGTPALFPYADRLIASKSPRA